MNNLAMEHCNEQQIFSGSVPGLLRHIGCCQFQLQEKTFYRRLNASYRTHGDSLLHHHVQLLESTLYVVFVLPVACDYILNLMIMSNHIS